MIRIDIVRVQFVDSTVSTSFGKQYSEYTFEAKDDVCARKFAGRFSVFYDAHRAIEKKFKLGQLPPFPPKKISHMTNPLERQKRGLELEKYFQRMLRIVAVIDDSDFLKNIGMNAHDIASLQILAYDSKKVLEAEKKLSQTFHLSEEEKSRTQSEGWNIQPQEVDQLIGGSPVMVDSLNALMSSGDFDSLDGMKKPKGSNEARDSQLNSFVGSSTGDKKGPVEISTAQILGMLTKSMGNSVEDEAYVPVTYLPLTFDRKVKFILKGEIRSSRFASILGGDNTEWFKIRRKREAARWKLCNLKGDVLMTIMRTVPDPQMVPPVVDPNNKFATKDLTSILVIYRGHVKSPKGVLPVCAIDFKGRPSFINYETGEETRWEFNEAEAIRKFHTSFQNDKIFCTLTQAALQNVPSGHCPTYWILECDRGVDICTYLCVGTAIRLGQYFIQLQKQSTSTMSSVAAPVL